MLWNAEWLFGYTNVMDLNVSNELISKLFVTVVVVEVVCFNFLKCNIYKQI